MPLGFLCAQCQEPIVVSFLKPGDLAVCRACGQHTAVPQDAATVDAVRSVEMAADGNGDVTSGGNGAPGASVASEGSTAPEAAGPPAEPREGECLNHPSVAAVGYCALCAESFCRRCLDSEGPSARCRSCLLGTIASATPEGPFLSALPEVPCKLATEALTMSLIGIICFGIILEPLALYRGIKARREIRDSPYPMSGEGKAMAAIIISTIVLAFNVLIWGMGFLTAMLTRTTR